MNILAKKSTLHGTLIVPGSKSQTIRALLFAAFSKGESKIYNPLPSDDCLNALRFIEKFGARVSKEKNLWRVKGIGTKWKQPDFVVDVGNSGTLLSFATAILATIEGYSVITGDASICTRPINDELSALRDLDCDAFATRKNIDAPPVIINGAIHCGCAKLRGNISQYVSALLVASSLIQGKTKIIVTEPKEIPFVKMTLAWLSELGVQVSYDEKKFSWYEIFGGNEFPSFTKTIPSDWSSATFPLIAAIASHSQLTLEHVDTSDVQGDKAIVNFLREMGANIEYDESRATVSVKQTNEATTLHGIQTSLADCPDVLPALSCIASFAEGDTILSGVSICRLKETDRVSCMRKELSKLGVACEEESDKLIIHGKGASSLHGAEIESYGDHRIAMAFASLALGLPSDEKLLIKNAECASVTFPNFYETLNALGANFVETK